jgi:hypothetical protein
MNHEEFKASLVDDEPPNGLTAPLMALWWHAKGNWTRAHALVDELETSDGMRTCIARGDQLRTQTIGTNAPGGDFISPHSKMSGRR